MKLAIANGVSRTVNKGLLKIKKCSPEIMLIGGLIGIGIAAVAACKATLKVDEVLDETKEKIDKVHEAVEKGATEAGKDYTVEDSKKDLSRIYLQTSVKFVELYGPSIALGALSVASVLCGHNILRKRYLGISAAYAAIDKSFKEYRGRVVDRFGADLDKELKYGIKAIEVEETVTDENGNETTSKKVAESVDPLHSPYAKFFDSSSKCWEKNPEYNMMFLRAQQNYANDMLKAKGHLFLNEVYDMLDIPRTKAGQVVGWIYDEKNPVGDNYVDFGIYDSYRGNERFVNGLEPVILLDFNVDGNIWDMM